MDISNGICIVKTILDWTIKRSETSQVEGRSTTIIEEPMIKPIEGFAGYFISDDGKVYCNLGKGNRRKTDRTVDLYEIKGRPTRTNYLRVYMRDSHTNKRVDKYIHRLVAQHFIPNPENKKYVNHINCNRADNSVKNLEWVTAKENTDQTVELKHVVRNDKGPFLLFCMLQICNKKNKRKNKPLYVLSKNH